MTTAYASEAFLQQLLGKALNAGASDVHLKVGQPPGARVRGDLVFFRVEKIRPEDTEAAARVLLGPVARDPIAHDAVFAWEGPAVGRFRVSVFRQRGALSLVMRSIPRRIPTPADLGLPAAAISLIGQTRGLVVLAGAASSGRSTTAAALLGHLNEIDPRHVITFEDPIEHLHEDQRSCFAQREIGADVPSLAAGLRAALRHDPDVLYAADLGTPDAMEAALDAAELGHLVLASIAAPDVPRAAIRLLTLSRALHDHNHRLAAALQGIVAQRLISRRDGSGEILACEVLLTSSPVREALRRNGAELASALREQMEKGANQGMQTFEMHIRQLVAQGIGPKSMSGA